jgi:tetratricopeptide (TPR) repeat protein
MINDFDLLLKKCKARAFKRILRIALRILGSILLFGLAVFGYFQWKMSTQETVIIKPSSPPAITPIVQEENYSIPVEVIAEVVKVPVAPTPVVPVHTPILNTPLPSTVPIASKPAPLNSHLEVSTSSASMTPEQAYQRSPKFETALGIARDFYTKEDYAQAAIWAKKANQMNREAEEAWLLYAKSYYAQGKKTEAISVLELFLNYKDSKAASDLIKAWR